MVNLVSYVDEMEEVLVSQYDGEDKCVLYLLHGLNTDSGNFSKPAEFKVSAICSCHLHPTSLLASCYYFCCIRESNTDPNYGQSNEIYLHKKYTT